MTSREDNVLAARDPSLDDENDWEEFSLSEVRILVPGKSRYANLLAASEGNPVQVTGRLDEVEEEQGGLVLDDDYQSKRIVIENVTHYAYGQHNDGEVGIWVAGHAGWFSISPAKGYRPVFMEMVEAIDLLYFLADRHQNKRRKRKDWNPSVEYLLDEYVGHTHGICEDADDSAEVLYKHHAFLLSRMVKGEEGVLWTKTDLFAHLCEKFPEAYEEIKAEQEAKENDEEPMPEEEQRETCSTPEKSTPEQTTPEKPQPREPAVVSRTQADTIYQVILDLKDAGHLAKRQLNMDLVVSTLVGQFSIDNSEYAVNLISARAKSILKMMDEAKTANFDWSRKAIYRELKNATKRKKDAQNITLTPLRPRAEDNNDSSSEEESEEEEREHDKRHPRHRRRRVRKSVLRPKLSSVSAKQIGKRTRGIAPDDDDDDEDDFQNDAMLNDFATPSKVRGHELVRDPLSTTKAKRTRSILSDTESTTSPGPGGGNARQPKSSLCEVLQSRNTSVVSGGTPPDPSIDDTWTCQVRGCGKSILKSSSKRGQESISEHSSEHENETQSKLDLVFAEKQLNDGLPVDNLLSRIREMGAGFPAASEMMNEVNGPAAANAL